MTTKDKINFILENQVVIDESLQDDFPDFPFTSEDLNAMNSEEVGDWFDILIEAMDIADDNYNDDYIRHGRSE